MNSLLPSFSLSRRVSHEDAKQDHIHLVLGEWFIQGIGNDLGAFFDLLGPAPDLDNPSEINTNLLTNILSSLPIEQLRPEIFGWIFNRPAGSLDEYTELEMSRGGSGSNPSPGTPLATGKLYIHHSPAIGPHCDEARGRMFRLSLFLNPTRFLRHQRCPPLVGEPPETWILPPANMRRIAIPRRTRVTGESTDADIETSLDGNDNVILGRRHILFSRAEAWPLHLRRYLQATEDTLQSEFDRVANALGFHLNGPEGYSRTPYYSLQQVETYFEFTHPNPTQLVRILQPALESIGREFTSREYPVSLIQSGIESNSRTLRIQLTAGTQLRVYAKTTHRIRFEIVHDVTHRSVSTLLHAEEGGYTTQSNSELLGWFRLLALDAANKINEVFSTLENRTTVPIDSADSYELIAEIFATVRNAHRAKQIIELLVEHGCLRVGRSGTDFLPEIKQLRRQGILENVADTNCVTPRYRTALDTLRTQAGLPALTAFE